jgi:hypothetical protein
MPDIAVMVGQKCMSLSKENRMNHRKQAFNQISQSAVYAASETSVSITVCGGSCGGGSEVLVVELSESDDFESVGFSRESDCG